MVPEIVRLERAGVCGCGELVGAGERAGYAALQEKVVCLACMAGGSPTPGPGAASPGGDAVLPATWTADELVIAATLKALREASAPAGRASMPAVLHVPTEWSNSLSGPAPLAGQAATQTNQLITLPRRKARTETLPDADGAGSPEPTGPITTPPAAPTVAPEVAPSAALEPGPTAAAEVAGTEAQRSRHEAAAVPDLLMPATAPRRRAGLFTRLLSVRSFRTQQGQPRVGKPQAAVCAILDAATTNGVLSLHNRRVPGRRGRIEHIAIGAAGVYVIDVLHFKNASIEVRPTGEADATGDDLVVGGRVMTAAVRAIAQRVEVLRMILVAAGLDDVPVTGALCFVDGLLPLSVADLEIGGMHVVRPSGLTALVAGSGPYGPDDRDTLQQFLAERLPAVA